MVLARVGNVKSGWKSMFMVFTTAAADDEQTIVRLAFETIEKIVREHFQHITETVRLRRHRQMFGFALQTGADQVAWRQREISWLVSLPHG